MQQPEYGPDRSEQECRQGKERNEKEAFHDSIPSIDQIGLILC
jgi:hypothetical protein